MYFPEFSVASDSLNTTSQIRDRSMHGYARRSFGGVVLLSLAAMLPISMSFEFEDKVPADGQVFWAFGWQSHNEGRSVAGRFEEGLQSFSLPTYVFLGAANLRWDPCDCLNEIGVTGVEAGFGPISVSLPLILLSEVPQTSKVIYTEQESRLLIVPTPQENPDPQIIIGGRLLRMLIGLTVLVGVVALVRCVSIVTRLGTARFASRRMHTVHWIQQCKADKWVQRVFAATIFAIPAILAYRLHITVDGYFYLSSAQSLIDKSFAANYLALREPIYPAFLAIFLIAGAPSVLLAVVSSSLVGLAYSGASQALKLPLRSWLLSGLLLVASPTFVGYSGTVLQQTLMLGALTYLFGAGLGAFEFNSDERLSDRNEYLFPFLAGMTGLLSMFLLPAAAVAVAMRATKPTDSFSRLKYFTFSRFVALSLVSAPIALWSAIKAATFGGSGARDGFGQPVWPPVSAFGYTSSLESVSLAENVMGFFGLQPDMPGKFARELWAYGLKYPVRDCALLDDFDPIIVRYALDGFQISCQTFPQALYAHALSGASAALLAGLLLFSILLAIIRVFLQLGRRRVISRLDVGYLLFIVAFVAPYVLFVYGISRYSLPLFGPAVLYLLCIRMRCGKGF